MLATEANCRPPRVLAAEIWRSQWFWLKMEFQSSRAPDVALMLQCIMEPTVNLYTCAFFYVAHRFCVKLSRNGIIVWRRQSLDIDELKWLSLNARVDENRNYYGKTNVDSLRPAWRIYAGKNYASHKWPIRELTLVRSTSVYWTARQVNKVVITKRASFRCMSSISSFA